MEPEGSLPNSQQPDTCPYPQPDQSSSRPPIPLFYDPFQHETSTYSQFFQVAFFFEVSPPKLYVQSPLSPTRDTRITN